MRLDRFLDDLAAIYFPSLKLLSILDKRGLEALL